MPGSGWHQLIHIVSGLVLIGAGLAGAAVAVAASLLFGAGYLVLAISGLIDGDTVLGLFETYPADQALHALLGVAA
ncbi:MAG: DUF4383 domain-containing protein, partial [Thermoleophilaceae bacterium]|nr:DUF4383 domain-containing protein [Thermoleophilaceae bacterium]